jgi:hypothetical protein
MKAVSLTFLAVFWYTHASGDAAKRLDLPMSMLRDGAQSHLGYLLFTLLLGAGALLLAASLRLRYYGHALVFSLATVLLFLVAVTPSNDDFHLLTSLLLFALLYSYYAIQLLAVRSVWLWVHLLIPVCLLLATHGQSYGLWQKGFILYFLLAINVQHHLLARGLFRGLALELPKGRAKGWQPRRRVVYVLDTDENWARRR